MKRTRYTRRPTTTWKVSQATSGQSPLHPVNYLLIGPKDCIKLSVPGTTGESTARLRWRMRFQDLPDYTVDNIKPVALRQLETIHLIQTDKAWYTPGQLVRFRILSLNHILYPLLDPVCLVLLFSSLFSHARPSQIYNKVMYCVASIRLSASGWKIRLERLLYNGPI